MNIIFVGRGGALVESMPFDRFRIPLKPPRTDLV